jgi:uncharacterized coiled-coil protein SlyX
MLGKTRIEQLEARNQYLQQELDKLRRQAADKPAPGPLDWEGIAKQLAKDRTKAERADRWHIGRLEADLDGLVELCAIGTRRLQRLARAVWRLRKTIADQNAVIAELTRRVDHWEGGDRALRDAVPAASVEARIAELEHALALRDEQIRGLDKHIANLEAANRSTDWQQLRAAS